MFMPAAKFGLHYYPGGLRRYVTALGMAQALDAEEMLRAGFLIELVAAESLAARVAAYVSALQECEPGVVASMKAQLNAIAAGEAGAAQSRTNYEVSLRSPALRQRLAALLARSK